MPLGTGFRVNDLEKALRRVRTMAGVKFFGQPIGSIITPDMVKAAKQLHGDKKTQTMLESQRRNTRRDARQSHFQNQALVRAKKRTARVEANAERREAERKDAEIRGLMAGRQPSPAKSTPTPPPAAYMGSLAPPAKAPAPKAAPAAAPKAKASRQATNKNVETLFDLVHHQGKWDDTQVGEAIRLAVSLKATADPQVRELLMALVKRLQKEEK